jgi:hypothetical protein
MTPLEKISRMTASDSEPKLEEADLSALLAGFARPDAEGRPPTDLNWTPGYDLNAAAAEGWRWKAARASEMIAADLDGAKLSAEQLFEHCERMIGVYAKRVRSTVSVSP